MKKIKPCVKKEIIGESRFLLCFQIAQVAEYEARNSTQSTIGNYPVSRVSPY